MTVRSFAGFELVKIGRAEVRKSGQERIFHPLRSSALHRILTSSEQACRPRCRDRFEFAATGSEEMETEEELSLWNETMSLR
jgi:hypothetical protein